MLLDDDGQAGVLAIRLSSGALTRVTPASRALRWNSALLESGDEAAYYTV